MCRRDPYGFSYGFSLAWGDVDLDPERLKGLFELYFEQNADKSRQRKEKYEEYSLTFALSQMFSPKQKELIKGLGIYRCTKFYAQA